jgi:hypothetical protein
MHSATQVTNPIRRVWVPKSSTSFEVARLRRHIKFDHYGNELPEPIVQEKNTDSIWATYESLQAADA